jgi:hypothetical protein
MSEEPLPPKDEDAPLQGITYHLPVSPNQPAKLPEAWYQDACWF